MDDRELTELLLSRDERGIEELRKKYKSYCFSVANRILDCPEDSEECFDDVLLRVWNSIPPANPQNLSTYVGRIARNAAVDRLRAKTATGRCPKEGIAVLDEFEDIASDGDGDETDRIVLRDALNGFLSGIGEEKMRIFVKRYYFMLPISEIASDMGLSEGKVTVTLSRLRKKLKIYLEKEGIYQ